MVASCLLWDIDCGLCVDFVIFIAKVSANWLQMTLASLSCGSDVGYSSLLRSGLVVGRGRDSLHYCPCRVSDSQLVAINMLFYHPTQDRTRDVTLAYLSDSWPRDDNFLRAPIPEPLFTKFRTTDRKCKCFCDLWNGAQFCFRMLLVAKAWSLQGGEDVIIVIWCHRSPPGPWADRNVIRLSVILYHLLITKWR